MTLRIGVLGTGRIVVPGIVDPARKLDEVEVVSIAARDPARARSVAADWQIPRVHASYDALIADPEIDAVYVALPNSLHAEYAIKSLCAHKHVLVEKPFATSAKEASLIARAARGYRRVAMEAMHWQYHPFARAFVTAAYNLRPLHSVEIGVNFVIPFDDDTRLNAELGGGALADAGCYAVSLLGAVLPPWSVAWQKVRGEFLGDVDIVVLADGIGALCHASPTVHLNIAISPKMLRDDVSVLAVAENGDYVSASSPLHPYRSAELHVCSAGDAVVRTEFFGGPTTYDYQLREFVRRIHDGVSEFSAEANLTVIDDLRARLGIA